MELSANRRYTSKLVLEDTTIVFQKTKGERAGKNKSIHALVRKGKKLEDPNRAAMLPRWPWDHRSPGWLEPYHVTRTSPPTNVSQASCTTSPPQCKFCIAGPVSLQVSPQRCLVARELYIAAEELTWPRRAEKQQAWLGGRLKTLTEF